MADHYFSAAPASAAERRVRGVRLGGRDIEVSTAGGVFSPAHVDTGTRVLLDHVPEPPPGDLLDLGCGWGPIALDAALRAREAATAVRVWALDVNERARELTAHNAATLGLTEVRAVTASQLPAEVEFAAIWSNPPIRIGKAALHDLLLTWLPRLAPGAAAHLVVAKKLGADSLVRWLDAEVGEGFSAARIATAKGFRVLRVERAG